MQSRGGILQMVASKLKLVQIFKTAAICLIITTSGCAIGQDVSDSTYSEATAAKRTATGCVDASVNSQSQLIQLLDVTEPLVVQNCVENSRSAANKRTNETVHLDEGVEESIDWRFRYVDESKPGFDVLNRERSFDERFANLALFSKEARLFDMDLHLINTGNPKQDMELRNMILGSKVNEASCQSELELMVSILAELTGRVERFDSTNVSDRLNDRHIRLAQVLDTYGRYESGSLSGNTFFIGNYEQCVTTQLQMNAEQPNQLISTRYCHAKLSVKKHIAGSLEKLTMKGDYLSEVDLTVGVCVPESCHSDSIMKYKHLFADLLYSQFQLPRSLFIDQKPGLVSVQCLPDEDSPFRQVSFAGKLFIVTLSLWSIMIAFFTYVDLNQPKKLDNHWGYLSDSLNLKKSWQDFMMRKEIPARSSRIQLDCLNPIRFLGCVYVIYGHSCLVHTMTSVDILRTYNQIDSDPTLTIHLSGTNMVDAFYVISGIMLTFVTMRRLRGRNIEKSSAPDGGLSELKSHAMHATYLTVTRYVRLFMLYFFVYWFIKGLLVNLGSGPIWDYGLNKETIGGGCRLESWTTPFLFTAAYKPLDKQCLGQAWSISGDMFFAIFLAPIIVVMSKRPKLAGSILTILSLMSLAAATNTAKSIDSVFANEAFDFRFYAIFKYFYSEYIVYTGPHYRIYSVAVGCFAGYLLHQYNEQNIKEWPAFLKGTLTKLAMGLVISILMAPPCVTILRSGILKTYPIHQGILHHFNSTSRLVWSSSVAILCIRMTTDWKDSCLMRNSAGKFWKIANNLNYAMFLTHLTIASFVVRLNSRLVYFSRVTMFSVFASTFIICLMVSLILHLCIENPLDKLIRGYIDRFLDEAQSSRKRSQPQRDQVKDSTKL